MATVIRLKRGGRTHAPFYRVVVMDGRIRTCGRVLEEIGVYQPCARPEPIIEVDAKRALAWLHEGAQCSDTVKTVLKKQGILEMFMKGVKPEAVETPAEAVVEAAPEAAAEAVAEAPAEAAAEAPAEAATE